MTSVGALLAAARRRLAEAGIATAGLDARLLLQQAAGLDHAAIVADPGAPVGAAERQAFETLLRRRLAHEPVSRIIGEREFYGRAFRVSPAVLDPRPDTETVVAAALEGLPAAGHVLDLGTGSGAIAITLLAERPDLAGVASDISPQALAIAAANAAALGVGDRLDCRQSDWFAAIAGRFDLIVANPPYIDTADIAGLAPEVRDFDPRSALDGGADGLQAYRAIAAGAADHLRPEGRVVVEIGAGQAADVEGLFAAQGFRLLGRRLDLGGHVRALVFGRRDAASCAQASK